MAYSLVNVSEDESYYLTVDGNDVTLWQSKEQWPAAFSAIFAQRKRWLKTFQTLVGHCVRATHCTHTHINWCDFRMFIRRTRVQISRSQLSLKSLQLYPTPPPHFYHLIFSVCCCRCLHRRWLIFNLYYAFKRCTHAFVCDNTLYCHILFSNGWNFNERCVDVSF